MNGRDKPYSKQHICWIPKLIRVGRWKGTVTRGRLPSFFPLLRRQRRFLDA
jgi:hypothetical protein